jgi:predicted NUDIX family phosphoesterase
MTQIKKEDEIIVVVNRKKLFNNEELAFQGSTSDKEVVNAIMLNMDKHYRSMRRGGIKEANTPKANNAELNFDYKQPIPYIVIRRGNQYFVTERLQGGGESRLHGKLSMGIGGHMNPLEYEYYSINKVILENTIRELNEEISITGNGEYNIETVGLINDDLDDVGRVHIGILGFLVLEEGTEVTVKEKEQLAGHWYTLDQLKSEEVYSRLENWGKIVVDML